MPFLLLLIVEGGLRHAAQISETWVDVTILGNLMQVLTAVILVPLGVSAYRLVLLGKQTVKADAIDEFPPGTLAVLGLSVTYAVAMLPFTDMLRLMENERELMPSVALAYHAFAVAGWLFGILMTVRFSFLFIQAVLGRDLNISLAWRQTAGNGWRLFGVLLVTQLPLIMLAATVDSLTLEPLGGEVDFAAWYVWAGLLTQAAVEVAAGFLMAVVTALAFATLTGHPLPGGKGGAPAQPSLPFDTPAS